MIVFASLLVLILNGCVTPPSVPACAEISPSEGYCVNTMTDEEFYINDEFKFEGKTWWELRPLMLHLPPSSWAAIKSYIIKSCKKYGNCDSSVTDWPDKINKLDGLLE